MLARTSRILAIVASLWVSACGNDGPSGDPAAWAPDPTESATILRSAGGALTGTLRVPAGGGPYPVTLIVGGSGPTDRDGNSTFGLRTDAYRELAAELAKRGVASVRYDKRGVGASAKIAEIDLRPQNEADDVAAWLSQLKADPRFSSVTLIGHSEGALLGLLAMQKVPAAAFVSLAGPGRRMAQVFREQLARQLEGTLLEEANRILDRLDSGQRVADVPAELASVFRPSVQPYLVALLRYDASVELGKLAVPTLIAQGTTDVQITVADAQGLAAARPDAEILVVDGMCHTLKMASSDSADQMAALTDSSRPLAPALVDGVGAFFHRKDHAIPGG